MAAPKSAPEPSMEDILASIRRIISDESGSAAPEPREFEDDFDKVDTASGAEADVTADTGGLEAGASNSQDDIDALFGDMDMGDDTGDAMMPDMSPEPEMADTPATEIGDADDADDVLELTEEMTVPTEADVFPETVFEPDIVPPPTEPMDDLLSIDAEEASEPAVAMADPDLPDMDAAPPQTLAASMDRLMSPETDQSVRQAFGDLASRLMSRESRTVEDLITEMLRPMLKDWIDDNLSQIVERLVREEIERVSRGGR